MVAALEKRARRTSPSYRSTSRSKTESKHEPTLTTGKRGPSSLALARYRPSRKDS